MDSDVLTINYVFQSVILATLKSSNNNALRAVYDQILDDLDDEKDITFATFKPSVLANSADQGATLGSTSPRRDPTRYAAPLANQNLSSTTSTSTRWQRTRLLPLHHP